MTIGVTGSATSGWSVAYVSSSLTRDSGLEGRAKLSAAEAWVQAALSVGEQRVGARDPAREVCAGLEKRSLSPGWPTFSGQSRSRSRRFVRGSCRPSRRWSSRPRTRSHTEWSSTAARAPFLPVRTSWTTPSTPSPRRRTTPSTESSRQRTARAARTARSRSAPATALSTASQRRRCRRTTSCSSCGRTASSSFRPTRSSHPRCSITSLRAASSPATTPSRSATSPAAVALPHRGPTTARSRDTTRRLCRPTWRGGRRSRRLRRCTPCRATRGATRAPTRARCSAGAPPRVATSPSGTSPRAARGITTTMRTIQLSRRAATTPSRRRPGTTPAAGRATLDAVEHFA